MTKKNAIILFFAALAAVILSCTAAIWLVRNHSASTEPETAVSQSAVQSSPYLLKEYQGKIALYVPSDPFPREIYDIYLSVLPHMDQERLREGIPVSDQKQLKTYLEEFDS